MQNAHGMVDGHLLTNGHFKCKRVVDCNWDDNAITDLVPLLLQACLSRHVHVCHPLTSAKQSVYLYQNLSSNQSQLSCAYRYLSRLMSIIRYSSQASQSTEACIDHHTIANFKQSCWFLQAISSQCLPSSHYQCKTLPDHACHWAALQCI